MSPGKSCFESWIEKKSYLEEIKTLAEDIAMRRFWLEKVKESTKKQIWLKNCFKEENKILKE